MQCLLRHGARRDSARGVIAEPAVDQLAELSRNAGHKFMNLLGPDSLDYEFRVGIHVSLLASIPAERRLACDQPVEHCPYAEQVSRWLVPVGRPAPQLLGRGEEFAAAGHCRVGAVLDLPEPR